MLDAILNAAFRGPSAVYAAAMLTAHSEVLAALVASHALQIASAMHAVSTGVVTWFT